MTCLLRSNHPTELMWVPMSAAVAWKSRHKRWPLEEKGVKENKWEGMGRNGMRIILEMKYNIESRVSSFTAETIRELTACDGVKSSSSDSSSCNGRWPNMANQKSEKRKNEREKSGAILHQCLCNTKKCLVPSLVVLLWLCLFL